MCQSDGPWGSEARLFFVLVFANLVTDDGTSGRAAQGAQGATNNRITHHTANNCTYACAQLLVIGTTAE